MNKRRAGRLSAARRARNRMFFSLLVAVVVSACATTNSSDVQRASEGQNTCSPSGNTEDSCIRSATIEIDESYPVDEQTRKEFDRAVALLEQEKYEEGIDVLKRVTGKTEQFTAPYINLGVAYAKTGATDKAEENLRRALEINDRHPVARNELGLLLRKSGRYQEAKEMYQATIDRYPGFLPARKNLGVLCDIYLQDLDCALKQYQEYMRRMPNDEKVEIWLVDVKNRMR